ncbi:tetratricopeptide repeat protein [Gracilimonas amylolytica]|uniref:tetratricopeptide repeat protein n=1 Tax=Gracilimonas amylolytica TaxID=1749045 RepID=UPI000CD8B57E|nr:tetratricopeptide repeat protein [Gracilimonas amylolytica]
MIKHITYILSFLFLLLSTGVMAQNSSDYQLAVRLIQQQEYSEALPILEELHQKDPDMYVYADRLIDCLIQVKDYDRGLEIAGKFKGRPNFDAQIKIRIGELNHYLGNEERALEIWKSNISENPKQYQIYINTARKMVDRREYLEAVDVYKQARTDLQNKQLFFGDIANAYMQAGEYELAINEWLALLEESPNQITFIQRSLLRFNDPILYDITIVELNDRLSDISVTNSLYRTYYELQIWLLQENKLYRRALAAAKEYENRSNSYNYSVFNLGRQLVENNEFELAIDAFSFYTDNTFGELRWRSLEELSETYSRWAKYLDDFSLERQANSDSLYNLSMAMLDSIETETNSYSRMSHVFLKKAELSLDHIFNLETAERSLEKLKSTSGTVEQPEIPYLEGRIHLSKKEFPQARIQLTRSNKMAEIGEIAEKTRYFLALTDFYAGDFEFATIQLKTLGRNNTSFYANDALALRLWLQDGLSIDTTGSNLKTFAEAVFLDNNGKTRQGAEIFSDIITDPEFYALKDDAILFYVQSPYIPDEDKYTALNNFLTAGSESPVKEKLLWEKALLSERLGDSTQLSVQPAEDIFEELILSYPTGFYAPYAREKLTEFSTSKNS